LEGLARNQPQVQPAARREAWDGNRRRHILAAKARPVLGSVASFQMSRGCGASDNGPVKLELHRLSTASPRFSIVKRCVLERPASKRIERFAPR